MVGHPIVGWSVVLMMSSGLHLVFAVAVVGEGVLVVASDEFGDHEVVAH